MVARRKKPDLILAWALRQRREWEAHREALMTGVMTTAEYRRGKKINTSDETLADIVLRMGELESLIERHKANA